MSGDAGGQRGQVLVIFALMAVFIVGVVALAVDYGFLTNQHRSFQEFVDDAALAGASQLRTSNPQAADYTNARTAAFLYLRKGLNLDPSVASLSAVPPRCPGTPAHTDFSQDLDNCPLPGAYSNYIISIDSPAKGVIPNVPNESNTVSVQVSETVSTSLAAVIPQASAAPGAAAVAQYFPSANDPFTVWSHGVVAVGNQLQVIQGSLYIESGGIAIQSVGGGQGALCVEKSGTQSGNITLGPGTVPNSYPSVNQNVAQAVCQGAAGGQVDSMGSLINAATSVIAPTFIPPPGIPECVGATGCVDAQATFPCTNHTVTSGGATPANCFRPGAYKDINGIDNNLNPGIYHIVGNQDPAAGTLGVGTVTFAGDTMNANFNDVRDMCWTQNWNFSGFCPDGFAIDPTNGSTITDDQCNGYSGGALLPPAFTVTSSLTPGSLDPLASDPTGLGITYYVRVSARNAFGESATNELPVLVKSATHTGSITLTITAELGATGYQVYGPSTSPGAEVANGAPSLVLAQTLGTVPSGTTPYPLFDTSTCNKGFRNIPKNADENNGVTFVLDNNVDMHDNKKLNVFLSPYCSVVSNNDLPSNTQATCWPPTHAGDLPGPYASSGPNMNDGAFVLYGTSAGKLEETNNGTVLAMSGTLDVPSLTVWIDQNAIFSVVPGQMFVRTMQVQSGNHTNPLVIGSQTIGARIAPVVRLVQ